MFRFGVDYYPEHWPEERWPEDCAHLNLGYLDPAKIDINEWKNREDEGVLYVPKAGEILYRLK